jgi:hypothetical protein
MVLEVIFGLIGVASLGYAVWQNRSAESAKQLTHRITSNVRALAQDIVRLNAGTPTEGYARSIVEVSTSLLGDSPPNVPIVGDFSVAYYAPEAQTKIGAVVKETDTNYGYALKGVLKGAAVPDGKVPLRAALVYGPYKTLPLGGSYRAEFRLRREGGPLPESGSLIRLDVFHLQTSTFLATRFLTPGEVPEAWDWISLEFDYADVRWPLEYRVIVLQPGPTVFFEVVKVRWLS